MTSTCATRLLLASGGIGAVLFVAVWSIDGATRPGYSSVRHPVSALALGERGWMQTSSFVATGVLMGAFALGLHRVLGEGPAARWAPVLLAAFALGLIASGAFAMDPIDGYPSAGVEAASSTWRGTVHDLAGLVVFSALPLAALVLAARFRAMPELRWLSVPSSSAAALTFGLFVAYLVVAARGGSWGGLVQRSAILVGWGWVALVAGGLLGRGAAGGS